MVSILKLSALILTVLLFASCGNLKYVRADEAIPYTNRTLIAVGDMQNRTGNSDLDGLMEGLTGNFIYELHNTQCFRLIERERLKGMLDESKLGMSGLTDPKNTKQIGKLLGVDAILFVNLASVIFTSDKKSVAVAETEKEKYDITLDARLVAVETGEILAASKITKPVENEYSSALFLKVGEKADTRTLVKKVLEESVQYLAKDLAAQAVANSKR
jgi:curli biogenesis system outer membrane secretion channel CsgG